jgi:DNA-binding MarR family transcriptional regulator
MSILTCDVACRLGWAQSAELRMRELADHVRMISGGRTRLADRLECDGLITRSRGAEDLRGYEARITSVGRKALRRANRQHVEDVRELFLDHVHKRISRVLAGMIFLPFASSAGFSLMSHLGTACAAPARTAACENLRCVLFREVGMAPAWRGEPGLRVSGQALSGIVVLGGRDKAGLRRSSLIPGVARSWGAAAR